VPRRREHNRERLRAAVGYINMRLRSAARVVRWLYQARPRVIAIHGTKLRIGYHISPTIAKALLEDRYETRELKLLRRVLTETDRVMELGAGLGFLAAFCSKEVGNDHVIAYEANPRMEHHIRETFRLNGVEPQLVMTAIGICAGSMTFYLSRDFWTSSTIAGAPTMDAVSVPVRCFNDEVARFAPTVLIVDIEGGEVELLAHADLHPVRAVVLETHPHITGVDGVQMAEGALVRAGFIKKAEIEGECGLFQRV
jgi:FkbM family methyltransferase